MLAACDTGEVGACCFGVCRSWRRHHDTGDSTVSTGLRLASDCPHHCFGCNAYLSACMASSAASGIKNDGLPMVVSYQMLLLMMIGSMLTLHPCCMLLLSAGSEAGQHYTAGHQHPGGSGRRRPHCHPGQGHCCWPAAGEGREVLRVSVGRAQWGFREVGEHIVADARALGANEGGGIDWK